MPRVPVHDLHTAPEGSRDALKTLEARHGGKIINIFGAMAHAPAMVELFRSAEQALVSSSSLDAATREAIHLAVANVNGCDYCQAAYTLACSREGFTEEQTIHIRQGAVAFDPALDALLAVTREAAERKGYVADDTWQRALDADWSDQQLLEAFADTVRTILTNYFNHFVGTELDLPPAPALERS